MIESYIRSYLDESNNYEFLDISVHRIF